MNHVLRRTPRRIALALFAAILVSACSSSEPGDTGTRPFDELEGEQVLGSGTGEKTRPAPQLAETTSTAAQIGVSELAQDSEAVKNALSWMTAYYEEAFPKSEVLGVRNAWQGPARNWDICGYSSDTGEYPLMTIVFDVDMSAYRDDIDVVSIVTNGDEFWESLGLSTDGVWDHPTMWCGGEIDPNLIPITIPDGCAEVEWPALATSFDEFGDSAPPMTLQEGITYSALVRTSCGDFTILLDHEVAPNAVNSFVYLARAGFYDDVPVYRIALDFVFQAGRVLEDATGGPEYLLQEEGAESYPPYSVALANRGLPYSTLGQFFVVTSPSADASLSESLVPYSFLGTVIDGTETVDRIASGAWLYQDPRDFESQYTQFPLVIYGVEIIES